jgi:hypothetical protein
VQWCGWHIPRLAQGWRERLTAGPAEQLLLWWLRDASCSKTVTCHKAAAHAVTWLLCNRLLRSSPVLVRVAWLSLFGPVYGCVVSARRPVLLALFALQLTSCALWSVRNAAGCSHAQSGAPPVKGVSFKQCASQPTWNDTGPHSTRCVGCHRPPHLSSVHSSQQCCTYHGPPGSCQPSWPRLLESSRKWPLVGQWHLHARQPTGCGQGRGSLEPGPCCAIQQLWWIHC